MTHPDDDLLRLPRPRPSSRWGRYALTLAPLRPSQMARLAVKRLILRPLESQVPVTRDLPPVREPWTCRAPFLDNPPARSFRPESGVLGLLGLEKPVAPPVDWTPAEMPLLWQLELNYFHWLPLTCPWSTARPWIADWLERAPRHPHTIGWNPFGVAQRVLMWTRLIRTAWWEELSRDPLKDRLLSDLHAQCRYLARHQEKELLGNHLIKTAVGLYAGGRFFAGPDADGWLRRASSILRRQVREQVLDDGGHYERSPMYHLLVLVDLVDTLNVTPPGDRFEDVLRPVIERMARFAADCAHGDGEIPLFNDSVLDQAPPRDEVLQYADRVGGLGPRIRHTGFIALPQTGLFRLGGRRQALWFDGGETGPPFLQAHAHADTASFELSVAGRRIVCDRGVYSYQDREQRAWDRSTAAHNTLTIDGESSSDCWGSFRVGRRAHVHDLSWSDDAIEQSVRMWHDGFRHLPGSPRHGRSVTYRDGTYSIRDRVESRRDGPLRCDALLYFAPGVRVSPRREDAGSHGDRRNWGFDLTVADCPELSLRVEVGFAGAVETAGVFVEPAELAPRFHARLPGCRIRAACTSGGRELEIVWILEVAGEGTGAGAGRDREAEQWGEAPGRV